MTTSTVLRTRTTRAATTLISTVTCLLFAGQPISANDALPPTQRVSACAPSSHVDATQVTDVDFITTHLVKKASLVKPGRVKATVQATRTLRITVRATATADACPHGTPSPATSTLTKTSRHIIDSTRSRTSTKTTTRRARRAALASATRAAKLGATNAARRLAVSAAGVSAANAAEKVSAGGTQTGQPTPEELERFRGLVSAETIRLTNIARAEAGVGPVGSMTALTENATLWAQHMAETDTVEHSPEESQIPPALSACTSVEGVPEIIHGGGEASPQDMDLSEATAQAKVAVTGWLGSPAHSNYLLHVNVSRTGVGVGLAPIANGDYRVTFVQHLFRGECPELP